MKNSKYLLRANPQLTTNVKLVYDTAQNLYLESYSSNLELSDTMFKRVLISSDSFLSERIATFYKDLPSSTAFEVRHDTKSDNIQTDRNLQYDDIYYTGMRTVEDTRYVEEFQYNTTLKIEPDSLPKWFFIFRQDDAGIGTTGSTHFSIKTMNLNSLKAVQWFDLSKSSNIGKLFQKNFIDDDVLPRSPFELNLKQYEFSRWNGYDYRTGGTTSKSLFLDDYIRNQTGHFDLEKFITEGFQKNEIICSNYINVSYLFDDTVSGVLSPNSTYDLTKTYKFLNEDIFNGDFSTSEIAYDNSGTATVADYKSFRKRWTINRYYGFYLDDAVSVKRVSPYNPAKLITGGSVSVYANEFIATGSQSTPVPVNPITEMWDVNKAYYIKIANEFYLIEQQIDDNGVAHYNIISDKVFNPTAEGTVDALIADYDPIIKIVWNDTAKCPEIVYLDGTPFEFDYDTYARYGSGANRMLMVKIFDKFYNVDYAHFDAFGGGHCRLITDWYMTCDGNKFVRKYDSNKTETIFTQVLTKDYPIPYFEFVSPVFTEIADFDFSRIETDYAQVEYDNATYVNLTRPFLIEQDVRDSSTPKENLFEQDYRVKVYKSLDVGFTPVFYPATIGQVFALPSSSEYAVCGDLYMLDAARNLTSIWNINQSINKWGYKDSVNYCSYPYKLNNDITFSGRFNFTPNPYTLFKSGKELSLDWFYTIGHPKVFDLAAMNSSSTFYNADEADILFRSLNIDVPVLKYSAVVNDYYQNFEAWDQDYYQNPDSKFNYMHRFFNIPVKYGSKTQQLNRTSIFNEPDGVNGPVTFFRGINISAEIANCDNPNDPKSITFSPADSMAGYEFSVLFDNKETTDSTKWGKSGMEVTINRIWGNVLIYIYIWTPFDAITSMHFRRRDFVYSEDFVYYTYYDTVTSAYISKPSLLQTQSLKLNMLYTILNKSLTTAPEFTDEIKYTVVENKEKYFITGSSWVTNLLAGYDLTISTDKYLPFRHGDWVYVNIAGVAVKNYKILSVINKNTIKIQIDNQPTIPVPTSISYVTKELSKIPFRLRCMLPEEISIDQTVNNVVGFNNTTVVPDNKLSTIGGVVNFDISTQDTVEYVWNGNPMSRRIDKSPRTKELNGKEINALPKMLRYSGDYEPILKKIKLFNNATLQRYGNEVAATPGLQVYVKTFYVDSVVVNGVSSYRLVIEFCENLSISALKNPFRLNDIVYIKSLTPTAHSVIHNRMAHIDAISSYVDSSSTTYTSYFTGTFPAGIKVYRIVTNLEFASVPVGFAKLDNSNVLIERPHEIYGFTFKSIDANTQLDTTEKDYGVVKEVIISKFTDDASSPLKTSNPIYNDKNRYPMSDEHGVTVIDRNIWSSSWDYEYYYSTIKNKYNT